MKLRIKGSSLRLRLTQGEVRALQSGGEVTETVRFSGVSRLVYRLIGDAAIADITAGYQDNLIDIRVPVELMRRWSATDEVTLSRAQPNGAGELQVVIEKDWACRAPRSDEDESDNFPHPETAGGKTC